MFFVLFLRPGWLSAVFFSRPYISLINHACGLKAPSDIQCKLHASGAADPPAPFDACNPSTHDSLQPSTPEPRPPFRAIPIASSTPSRAQVLTARCRFGGRDPCRGHRRTRSRDALGNVCWSDGRAAPRAWDISRGEHARLSETERRRHLANDASVACSQLGEKKSASWLGTRFPIGHGFHRRVAASCCSRSRPSRLRPFGSCEGSRSGTTTADGETTPPVSHFALPAWRIRRGRRASVRLVAMGMRVTNARTSRTGRRGVLATQLSFVLPS